MIVLLIVWEARNRTSMIRIKIRSRKEAVSVPGDTAESLHARIQIAERALYPKVIAQFAEASETLSGRGFELARVGSTPSPRAMRENSFRKWDGEIPGTGNASVD